MIIATDGNEKHREKSELVIAAQDPTGTWHPATAANLVEKLKQQFDGEFRIKFNLAPPLLAKKDANGHLVKAEYGSWMWQAFRLLAKMKRLRGTAFDLFGRSAERRMERRLIGEYRDVVLALLERLSRDNLALAVEIAALPDKVRGFGHVKEKAVALYHAEMERLASRYMNQPASTSVRYRERIS